MKQFFKNLFLSVCLIMVSISAFAASDAIDISLTPSIGNEQDQRPSRGDRMPAAPVICTIDFENHRIETSIPYAITVYELWDEDGTAQLVSFANDYDMVRYMSGLTGAFQLRLVSAERTYVGYLDL